MRTDQAAHSYCLNRGFPCTPIYCKNTDDYFRNLCALCFQRQPLKVVIVFVYSSVSFFRYLRRAVFRDLLVYH